MPDIGQALDAALGARYGWPGLKTPTTTWRGLHAHMRALEKAAGSKAAAAQAAGIGRSTWNHWAAKHRMPSGVNLRKLEAAYARQVLQPAVARRIKDRKLPTLITVTAVIRWSNSPKKMYNAKRHRKTHLDQLKPVDIARVVQAWAALGGGAAGGELERVTAARYKAEVVKFEGDQVHVDLTPKWKGER